MKSKAKYHRWVEENMQKAVESVKQGQSIRKAAGQYSVPKSTLCDRVSGKISEGAKMGRPPVLPESAEQKIADNAIACSERGYGYSSAELMRKAGQTAKRLKLRNNFKDGVAGKNWVRGFRARHPELTLRKPEPLSAARSRMMNSDKVNKYYDDLDQLLVTTGIKNNVPGQIWNMDEKNLSFQHRPPAVIARKGCRNVPGRVGNSRETMTVVACVNDNGEAMPPTVIVKGATSIVLNSWETTQAPPNTLWVNQKNSYMTEDIAVEWFENVFLKYCGTQRPQILLLDSVKAHEKDTLLELAIANNIHVFAIPPHTSHRLQVLDVSVFGPLQKRYNNAVATFLRDPSHLVTRANWSSLFCSAWTESMTPSNIRNGFRACGIRPFDRTAISKEAFLPSSVSDSNVSNSTPQTANQPLSQESTSQVQTMTTNEPFTASATLNQTHQPHTNPENNYDSVIVCSSYSEALHSIQQSMPAELLLEYIGRFESSNHSDDPLYKVWAEMYDKSKEEAQTISLPSEVPLNQGSSVFVQTATITPPSNSRQEDLFIPNDVPILDMPTRLSESAAVPQHTTLLDDILPLPSLDTTSSTGGKPKTSKAITSHRILTSDAIMQQKRDTAEKKKIAEETKKLRAKNRQETQRNKNLKKLQDILAKLAKEN